MTVKELDGENRMKKMTTIIATIKSRHMGNIRRGLKIYEVRKRSPNVAPPFRVLCCESGSGGQIKCEFVVDNVLKCKDPHLSPALYEVGTCLSFDELYEYVGTDPFDMWHITNMVDYCTAEGQRVLNIAEFGLKRAPQSWCYLLRVSDG